MNLRKKLKRVLAILVVFVLNLNVFAAEIDHAGSEFVTKAEFDSLMERFNDNMDLYNTTLNSKIDVAIANYITGLSGLTTGETTVGYFSIIPQNITTVKMQNADSMSYSSSAPAVYIYGTFGSMFPDGKHGCATYGSLTYNSGSNNGRRRFAFKDGSITRWRGYCQNYRETFIINWTMEGGGSNIGFGSYLRMGYFSNGNYSTTASTGPYHTSNRFYVGGDTDKNFSATYCTVNRTNNELTFSNQYDLIYGELASQSANNLRIFIEGNPNNRWFAGSSFTYGTLLSSGSKGVLAYGFNNGSYWSSSTCQGTTSGGTNYTSSYFMSQGFENITKWDSIMCPDTTTYTYYNGDTTTATNKTNYSMVDGAIFCPVKKDAKYTWNVKFTDTSEDATIWLKYGEFNGAPNTSDCIYVSVDGGPQYKSGTIKEGKGTVTFTAEKNGLLFLKWTENKSIDIANSKRINIEFPPEE